MLYVIHVLNPIEGNKLKNEGHPVLHEYRDVFLKEVLKLPPMRDIDFSMELKPKVVLVSREPYRPNTLYIEHTWNGEIKNAVEGDVGKRLQHT